MQHPFIEKLHSVKWLLLILVVAVALRLVNIGAEPYWSDEILSLGIATSFSSVGEMVRYLGEVEVHPPLYYLIVRGWVSLFGTAETSVRMISVLASLGIITLTYGFTLRMTRSKSAALIAAALLAVIPAQLEYGQEARPYMLFTLCGVAAMWALWEMLQTRDRRAFAVYIIASTLGMYFHYSYLFILVGTSTLWFVLAVRDAYRTRAVQSLFPFFVAHTSIVVLFFPQAIPMLSKILLGGLDVSGLPRAVAQSRQPAFVEVTLESAVWVVRMGGLSKLSLVTMLLAKVAAVCGVVALLVRAAEKKARTSFENGAFLLWLVLVPVITFGLAPTSAPYSSVMARHVVFVAVPLVILIAWGVSVLRTRGRTVVLALLFASFILPGAAVLGNDAHWDFNYRIGEAAEFIRENYKEGDLVVTPIAVYRAELGHYLGPDIPVAALLPTGVYGQDVWGDYKTLGFIENETQFRVQTLNKAGAHAEMDLLDELHYPGRIWLFGFAAPQATRCALVYSGESTADHSVSGWFENEHWRTVFSAIGTVFPVELYERR